MENQKELEEDLKALKILRRQQKEKVREFKLNALKI